MNRSVGLVLGGMFVLSILGCGSDDDSTDPVTFEAWTGSIITDYDPATSMADLAARSTVVTEATLVDVEDGVIFGSSPDDESASHFVNLIFETDAGDRYYVERPRPAYMTIGELRSVMPLGASSVVYLQPNKDPRDENFFNVRDGTTWYFTTPQGWILDDADRGIITPLEGSDSLGFDPPVDGDTDLLAWLVHPPSSAVDGPVLRYPTPPVDEEGNAAEIDGELIIDDLCLYIRINNGSIYPVLWPYGTSWDPDNDAVALPNGDLVRSGDSISAVGGYGGLGAVGRLGGLEPQELVMTCAADLPERTLASINNSPLAVRRSDGMSEDTTP